MVVLFKAITISNDTCKQFFVQLVFFLLINFKLNIEFEHPHEHRFQPTLL